MENNALLRVNFEVNPQYIEQAAGMFVERKSRNVDIKYLPRFAFHFVDPYHDAGWGLERRATGILVRLTRM